MMKIINRNPELLSVGWVTGKLPASIPPRISGLSASFFIKATMKLVHGSTAIPWPEGPLPVSGDILIDGEPKKGLGYASDFVPFKPCGEFTAIGTAYPPANERKQFFARIRVGDCTRSIGVVGERHWVYGPAGLVEHLGESRTPPKATRLSYDNAWGAPDYALNPLGCGKVGQQTHLLELPDAVITLRNMNVVPAVFAPMPDSSPLRKSKLGTYSPEWIAKGWPWLPPDFDYSHFNAAHPSQWSKGYLRGDETLTFENMHPSIARYDSRLPGIGARCFVTRTSNWRADLPASEAKSQLEEVPMHLDTLWVDMDQEMLVLVWRGRTPVRTIKLPDLEYLLLFTEPLGSQTRSERELLGMIQKGLHPKPQGPELPPIVVPSSESIELEILKARKEMYQAKMDAYSAAAVALQESAASNAAAETEVNKLAPGHAVQLEKIQKQAAGNSPPIPTEAELHAMHPPEFQNALSKEMPASGVPSTPEPDAMVTMAEKQVEEEEKKRRAVEDEFPKGPRREDFFSDGKLNHLKLLKEGLEGVDMSGVDFSGLQLPGVNFRGARLAGAKFSSCRLFGADFTGADLAKADLSGADLTSANLTEADLKGCLVVGTIWRKSFFTRTNFSGLKLDGADFSGGAGPSADFSGASLKRSLFTKAILPCADFSSASVEKADFSSATLSFGDFRGCNAREAVFKGANLQNLRACDQADFSKADLRRVIAPKSVWEESNLDGADFQQADLNGARFCQATLCNSHFDRCLLKGSVFEDAVLTNARLTNADLMGAIFDRADLSGAILEGSNLYNVSFWESILLHASWRNSFTAQTRLPVYASLSR